MKKYSSIDCMKFLCAILVVIIHTEPFVDSNYILENFVTLLTRIAVPFFFTTSGYLIFEKIKNDDNSQEYIKKYLLRILKIYTIWSIIYLPVNFVIWKVNNISITKALILYIRDFLILGSYSSLWYLPGLILSVFICYKSYKMIGINKTLFLSTIIYLIGLVMSTYSILIVDSKFLKVYESIFVTTRNGIFYGFLFVVIGAYISIEKSKYQKINKLVYLSMFCLSMCFLGLEAICALKFKLGNSTIMWISMVPATFFIFMYCINIELKERKIYKIMRDLSILIYLVHGFIIEILKNIFIKHNIPNFTRFCVVVIISILVALLIRSFSLKNKKMKILY